AGGGLSSSSSPPPPPPPPPPPKGDWARGDTPFVAVMLTTAPLFASTIAAKSGSVWTAPPEAAAPACCGAGAVLPAAGTLTLAGGALALTGSSLVQPPATTAAAATANSKTLGLTRASIGVCGLE